MVVLMLNTPMEGTRTGKKNVFGICSTYEDPPTFLLKGNYSKIFISLFLGMLSFARPIRKTDQHLSRSFYINFQDNGWLFAHEAGHCIGGGHLRTKGNVLIIIAFKQFKIVL